MAMTGGTAYLVKSEKTNYGSNSWTTDLYIYVKVISQNVIANTSTIALGMYVYSKYSIAWSDFGTNGTSYIGTATSGSNCFTFTNGQSGSGTKWLIEDKQVTVYHNSNGTLTLPIYWHWGVNSPWGQYTGPSGSYNVTLSTIDRAAPTVTFSVSDITANGFKISANSTSTADIWQYSTNGGSSWMQFSTTASTSASITLSSLSPNTSYTVKIRARRQYNQVYFVEDDHPAVVTKQIFIAIQDELKRRSKGKTQPVGSKSTFTGKIRCSCCGKNYRRKTTPYNIVWCCSTYNSKGKKYCPDSKVIPEKTLKRAAAEILKTDGFSDEAFETQICTIETHPGNLLRFIFMDGSTAEYVWKDRSRSESWTEEMKAAAGRKTKERNANHGK